MGEEDIMKPILLQRDDYTVRSVKVQSGNEAWNVTMSLLYAINPKLGENDYYSEVRKLIMCAYMPHVDKRSHNCLIKNCDTRLTDFSCFCRFYLASLNSN